jgi:hypothetical protein
LQTSAKTAHELRTGLAAIAAAAPAGSLVVVSLPREFILEQLLAGDRWSGPETVAPADLTVQDLAGRYGKKVSTVRGWFEAGYFPGAYKLRGREWRAPAAAVRAFEEAERQNGGPGQGPVGLVPPGVSGGSSNSVRR